MEAWVVARWRRLLERLELPGPGHEALESLERGYASPARAYHTWAHVRRCLDELEVAPEAGPSGEAAIIEAALWFHDAVYEPRRGDNELRSARLARAALLGMRLSAASGSRVERLILATAHGEAPSPATGQEALVRDVDLAILSAPPPEFDAYDRAIRIEYAHVADARYGVERGALLRSFLARPRIFHTDRFHAERENAARANIRRAIARLPGVQAAGRAP